MAGHFPFDDERIRALSATRQGRASLGGYAYQASYAVARLASMLARAPLLGLDDYPTVLRYDWAEDLDELGSNNRTILTQCKRVDDIGEPAQLAEVLLSFAPKLLWTESGRRSELRFRVVCTDPRFHGNAPVAFSAGHLKPYRKKVLAAFAGTLATPPGSQSDRAHWQAEADAFGAEALFDAIWEKAEGFYLRGDAYTVDPSGMPLLAAEREALDLLLRSSDIEAARQGDALKILRALVHSNLISFDPVSGLPKTGEPPSPRVIRRTDVHAELFVQRTTRELEFRVITPQFLAEQRAKEKQMYVARPPQWADVIHGEDRSVRFLERDLTTRLLERVRSHILEPLARGTDERLKMLFLLGAPGAGKSTLVRRVAALLVERGEVTVADFGLNLGELDQDEITTIVADLKALATPERPVLLVLDDPFFDKSGWDKLLKRLARPGVPVGVIGASPDFLYDAFSASVRVDPFHTEVVTLPKPSGGERAALSGLHDREVRSSDEEEDFLVLAMEAAADEPFDKIVARIWTTLNDGHVIKPRAAPESLSWAVRAYLITCYFHRAYERCPESLLREALEEGGTVPENYDLRLNELTLSHGWRIFSVEEAKGIARHDGRTIGAGHHRIAVEAWKQRPAPAFDLAEWVIPASIRSHRSSPVGRLAGALTGSSDEADARFAARLAKAWSEASDANAVPGNSFALLAGFLATNGARYDLPLVIKALRRRAERMDAESWVAVLALRDHSSSDNSQRSFPEDFDLAAVIEAADFSIASGRATRFADALGSNSALREAYAARMFAALEGTLDWKIGSNALAWLFARVPVAEFTPKRLEHIREWLEEHPDESNARTKFVDVVMTFPPTDPFRQQFIKDTSLWLEQHPDNDNVRTKFLNIVGALPHDDELRRKVLTDTARWLEEHDHDTTVRPMFLAIAGATDVGFDTLVRSAALLDAHRRKSWQTVADAMVQPYLRAARLEKWRPDKRLRAIRDSITRWYEAVGAAPPDLDSIFSSRGFNTLAHAFRRFTKSGESDPVT